MSFYQSLGLKASDYVEITSFTHHPYYKEVLLEIPDNWDYKRLYNVPLDEMMQVDEVAKIVKFLASDEAAPIMGAAIDVFGKKA